MDSPYARHEFGDFGESSIELFTKEPDCFGAFTETQKERSHAVTGVIDFIFGRNIEQRDDELIHLLRGGIDIELIERALDGDGVDELFDDFRGERRFGDGFENLADIEIGVGPSVELLAHELFEVVFIERAKLFAPMVE